MSSALQNHKPVQKNREAGRKNTSTWHCLYKALSICDCTGTEKAQERHSNSQRRVSREPHSGQATRLSPLSSVTCCCTHCLPLNLYETRPFASLFSLSHPYCTNNHNFTHRHTHVHIHICNNIKAFILRPLLPTQIIQITHLWVITHRLGATDQERMRKNIPSNGLTSITGT